MRIESLCIAGMLACVFALAQQDKFNHVSSEIETMRAIQEEKEAIASREWAARLKCGENSSWNWIGDDLQCLTKKGRKTGPLLVAYGSKE